MNHTIVHFEIPADDLEKMKDFYKAVFDWKLIDLKGDVEYVMVHTVPTDDEGMLKEPGVNGGMYKRTERTQVPVNYISVESVDDYIEKVIRNGGRVIAPKMEVPNIGFIVWIADPEGNPIGLLQPASM
jgi:predicted enzyme related to lactoylglutathione lyase